MILFMVFFSRRDDGCNDSTGSLNCSQKNGDIASVRLPLFQKGVLRTNCIDCLDRTNVAQYAFGLAALGRQLHVLGFLDEPKIDLDEPLADDFMTFYETMGDTLALQYGGSAAHNKVDFIMMLIKVLLKMILCRLNHFGTRYFVKDEDSGRRPPNPRSSSEPYSVITAMLTWMLRSKMQLTCKYLFICW